MIRSHARVYWRPKTVAILVALAIDLVLVGLAVATFRLLRML